MFAELIRFVFVGGLSFAIDFVLLILFQEYVFGTWPNGVLISAALAFAVSLVAHYFLAAFWVFRGHAVKGVRPHAVAGTLFVVTNLVGLGINELCLWIGVSILAAHYIVVKLVATGIVMIWNYAAQKGLIFKERRHA